MRTISYTNRFKRDFGREKAGPLGLKLDALLGDIVTLLATDAALPREPSIMRLVANGKIIATAISGPT